MKIKKIINTSILGLVLGYLLVLTTPQFLFGNTLAHTNFKVYYHGELPIEELRLILDESKSLLEKSELFDASKTQKVFLSNSHLEYAFFAPIHRNAFAVNYPVSQYIFIAPSSIKDDVVIRNAEVNHQRKLSAVIAHETLHSMLEDHLGFLSYRALPSWKNEGYCDYVVGESSFNIKSGKEMICSDTSEKSSPSLEYFRYRMFVQYLFEERGISLKSFLDEDFDLSVMEAQWKEMHCKKTKPID